MARTGLFDHFTGHFCRRIMALVGQDQILVQININIHFRSAGKRLHAEIENEQTESDTQEKRQGQTVMIRCHELQ